MGDDRQCYRGAWMKNPAPEFFGKELAKKRVEFGSFWLNGDWVDKAIELNGNNDIKKDDVAIVVLEPGLARRAFGQCRATREKRRMIQS